MADDVLVLGAESVGSSDQHHIELKELELRQHNPWNGQRIRDLDISRQTLIVIVKRKGPDAHPQRRPDPPPGGPGHPIHPHPHGPRQQHLAVTGRVGARCPQRPRRHGP